MMHNSRQTAVCPGQPGWAAVPGLSKTVTHLPPSLSSSSSQALPTFPPRHPIIPLRSNTMKTRGFLEEMWTSQGQELSLLLYSPNSGVNEVKWSSVTHCMTSSWPAVATKTTARVSPAMHTRYFYAGCHSCHNPAYFRALGPTHNMPACVSWGRLGCLWYYVILISWDHFYCILADKVGNNRCFTDNRWAICLQTSSACCEI